MQTIPIHPVELAEMRVVGKKYQPSNGTEGEMFMDAWCSECQRDKPMREGVDYDECDADECCDILANTMAYDVDDPEYPSEWQFGEDGQPRCTAFVEAGTAIPAPRCKHTIDLFTTQGE